MYSGSDNALKLQSHRGRSSWMSFAYDHLLRSDLFVISAVTLRMARDRQGCPGEKG